jgi:hypothetical protein
MKGGHHCFLGCENADFLGRDQIRSTIPNQSTMRVNQIQARTLSYCTSPIIPRYVLKRRIQSIFWKNISIWSSCEGSNQLLRTWTEGWGNWSRSIRSVSMSPHHTLSQNDRSIYLSPLDRFQFNSYIFYLFLFLLCCVYMCVYMWYIIIISIVETLFSGRRPKKKNGYFFKKKNRLFI